MVAPLGDCSSRSVAETTPLLQPEVEAERVADGDDLFADGDLGRVAEFDRRELGRRLGSGRRACARTSCNFIGADDGGRDLVALLLPSPLKTTVTMEPGGHAALADHVGVGEDVAAPGHTKAAEAGADAAGYPWAGPNMLLSCPRTSRPATTMPAAARPDFYQEVAGGEPLSTMLRRMIASEASMTCPSPSSRSRL